MKNDLGAWTRAVSAAVGLVSALAVVSAACDGSADREGADAGTPEEDATARDDAEVASDAGTRADAGTPVSPDSANVWIDQNGGSCTVSASPIPYDGAGDAQSCASFDAAWDAMEPGQTARVVAGVYEPQVITGDKPAETWIIGEPTATTIVRGTAECFDPPEFGSASALCAMGDYLTLEHVTLDTGPNESNSSSAARPDGEHVTFRHVDLRGAYPNVYVTGAHFTWQHGSHGEDGVVAPPRRCDRSYGMPLWVLAPNVTLDDIRFNPKTIEAGAGPYCGADDTPHLENIRIEAEGTNLTIQSCWFVAGSDAGSGHIFTSVSPAGLVIRNSVFEPVNGSYAIQGSIGTGAVFAYNTFHQSVAAEAPGARWIGNLGAFSGCDGEHVANVWQGSGSCGSDTFVGTRDLEIDAGGQIGPTSPAIDAAEAPSAGDYCTHELGAVDREGGTRPSGPACDAGADERE